MEEYFTYLDGLRASGVTNMFGAAPYLERKFVINRKQAMIILSAWMNSYGDGTKPAAERAASVNSKGGLR